jgi:hypothetical protein
MASELCFKGIRPAERLQQAAAIPEVNHGV